ALAERIVTTSPDVTVSTNLAAWVNQRGLFHRHGHEDVFRARKVASTLKWVRSRSGQHMELGIAENNLFLLLAALGLAEPLFGQRLLPIGTLYDPFIARGLDALTYACYQDARFMLVATPSGITLAPEGGAHQSVYQPLIGIGQPGLAAFEPAFADELAEIMRWGFEHMQAPDGGSVYLRLSTRPMPQPERSLAAPDRQAIIDGGYWLHPPAADARLAIAYTGAVAPEATDAHRRLVDRFPGTGLLAVTSADRLLAGWKAAQDQRRQGKAAEAAVDRLLTPLPRDARLVTVLDGHPAALAWLGSVAGHRTTPLGIDRFGQSGDVIDLYHAYGIDADAIVAAGEGI
ncbi:MAG: transketolase, partial [Rhodospirillaceae bacterium]|nr:transketolase [Rhodospirillaceae bacterium]